jgi:LacI family transcriptional regulator
VKGEESGAVLLSDVARMANVSISTVSLVLRSRGRMSPETRARVKKVAEEIGYRPNLAASMLARQRREAALPHLPVAVIGMGTLASKFPATAFMQSFTKHAAERGFLLEKPETEDDVPKLLRILYYRGVRGVVLSHHIDTDSLTEKDVKPFSILIHGQPFKKSPFHRVSTEVFEGVRSLWEEMWNRGYRRIGAALFRHPQDIQDDFAREAAVMNCQARHRAARIPTFIEPLGSDQEMVEWVRKTRPDAVLAFGNWHYYVLKDAGFRIPEDFGFGGLHVVPGQEVDGMYEDFEELGRVTVIQLDTMIRHNETGFPVRPHQLLIAQVYKPGMTLPAR